MASFEAAAEVLRSGAEEIKFRGKADRSFDTSSPEVLKGVLGGKSLSKIKFDSLTVSEEFVYCFTDVNFRFREFETFSVKGVSSCIQYFWETVFDAEKTEDLVKFRVSSFDSVPPHVFDVLVNCPKLNYVIYYAELDLHQVSRQLRRLFWNQHIKVVNLSNCSAGSSPLSKRNLLKAVFLAANDENIHSEVSWALRFKLSPADMYFLCGLHSSSKRTKLIKIKLRFERHAKKFLFSRLLKLNWVYEVSIQNVVYYTTVKMDMARQLLTLFLCTSARELVNGTRPAFELGDRLLEDVLKKMFQDVKRKYKSIRFSPPEYRER